VSAALLALAALLLLLWLFLRNRAAVLPGEVVYQDTDGQPTLVSRRHRLTGRPDYVTRDGRGLMPIEVKSRACGRRGPHPGERAQLLAYCLLVEEQLGGTVHAGVLRYRDRSVTVPFGEKERREIAALLAEMDAVPDPRRSHGQAARCRACGFRARCAEALA
jgi:CRISPR-associated exonuclease Cas4